ncbi:MAG: hypothetical protein PVI40_03705 [Chlamydiota bacterium]|jgi:hypothetical protein
MFVVAGGMLRQPIVAPETNVCSRVIRSCGPNNLYRCSAFLLLSGVGLLYYKFYKCAPIIDENINSTVASVDIDNCSDGSPMEAVAFAISSIALCTIGVLCCSCADRTPEAHQPLAEVV